MLAELVCKVFGHKWVFINTGRHANEPVCQRCLVEGGEWAYSHRTGRFEAVFLKKLIRHHFDTVQIPDEKLLPTERALLKAVYK